MEKTKKKFDAVAMMRRIRDEMSAEIEGMDYEEQKRYLSKRLPLKREGEPSGEAKGRIQKGSR